MKLAIALAMALVAYATGALAQENYPQRPIRVIVPFPAGGGTDGVARTVAQHLTVTLQQPVVVENRPGAGTLIAAELVSQSPPDGYTVLWATSTTLGISPAMYSKPKIDPFAAFAPVALVTQATFLLVTHPSIPAKTLPDLIAYAKARPGQLNYASAGSGTPHHLFMEILKNQTGMDIAHVPYKGSGPAMVDLLAGRVGLMITDLLPAAPHLDAGSLNLIATAGKQRAPRFPDVPAIGELVPGFDAASWHGVLAPSATPKAIVDKLAGAILAYVRTPAFAQEATKFGMEPFIKGPDEFKAYLATDIPRWREIVARANVHAD